MPIRLYRVGGWAAIALAASYLVITTLYVLAGSVPVAVAGTRLIGLSAASAADTEA